MVNNKQLEAEERLAHQWSVARKIVDFVERSENDLNEPEAFPNERAATAIATAIMVKGDEILERLNRILAVMSK